MPAAASSGVGRRIAYYRRLNRLTQEDLARSANVHVGTVRKIERGVRGVSDAVLDALAGALEVDPSRLIAPAQIGDRLQDSLRALSAAIATYDVPEAPPTRSLAEMGAAVDAAVSWRLQAQYVRLAQHIPALVADLAGALHSATGQDRARTARLLVAAYRAADAVAYKQGARDLSARLIELMRWAATHADHGLLDSVVAYVRTETFFAARAHDAGLRALETAIDQAPRPTTFDAIAARGALHMRAAVVAGRGGSKDSAFSHLQEATDLADQIPEGVYEGTAFGPSSVRIHHVSVSVSLGNEHLGRALTLAREWKPPRDEVPAERRSGFYIELARAQLWAGHRDDAFESLKVARRIAPQHTREHPWVREDAAVLRRLLRADRESLSHFAEWCNATE
ncbi:helix-turn-helix transcriptional regulator [Streptomyces sp. ICBB 8177]|uniref:helix-turn-helix domain-containing protein n=1 Tax=Streptomyces sp. ICBB 8177 TaxID=563922 RepID=UPI000D674478|nr:helix-turn-helix transcriptional regulator [Streptomyces sp. ICBB 8177]PWI45953.1 transcriptional regulator [Streptomyces sp. ICBB 8177]